MIQEASITGLFKTLMILIGVFVLLRFLGQLMNAKRNMEEERQLNAHDRKIQKEKAYKQKNLGKTKVVSRNQSPGNSGVEDVDFEEVD